MNLQIPENIQEIVLNTVHKQQIFGGFIPEHHERIPMNF